MLMILRYGVKSIVVGRSLIEQVKLGLDGYGRLLGVHIVILSNEHVFLTCLFQ